MRRCTPFGTPDLQGLWTNTSLTFLQRPPIFKALVATDKEAAMMIRLRLPKSLVGEILLDPTRSIRSSASRPSSRRRPRPTSSRWTCIRAHPAASCDASWIVEPADGKIPFTDAGKKANKAANDETFNDPESRPASERCLTAVDSSLEGPPMMNSTGFNGNYQIIQTRDYVAINIEMNHDVRTILMGDLHPPAARHQPLDGRLPSAGGR